jgi:SAM-dependent methyltransferase
MSTSIFYQTPWLYEGLMRVLYLGGYNARSEALAALIPERSSVVDLCCGPATLYFKHLRFKQVSYTGLDINRGFVERLSLLGSGKVRNPQPDGTTVTGMVWDATADAPLPKGDYVIMQASLYHFLPDPYPIVDRMLVAAEKYVILTEPVRNLTDSKNPLIAGLSRKLTNPGTGDQPNRFNEKRFEEFLERYRDEGRVVDSYPIAAGREKLCVLRANL